MDKQLQGEIATQYLEKWPNLNTLTLAKIIYKENPEVWRNVESVRNMLRYYRGASGPRNRKYIKDKRFLQKEGEYCIPESDNEEYTPFRIPQAQNNILFMSDLHIPYHDEDALKAAFNYGQRKEINTIILGGDILDCYQLSTWVKDPRRRHFPSELDVCREFLDSLQEAFPMAVIYFIQGNHEERLEKYLKIKAPELFGLEEFRLDMLLGLGERGIHWIQDRRYLQAGKLNILHGHEIGGGAISPVNASRTLFLKTKSNTLAGHRHQTSEHSEPTIDGDIIACWSVGCLSDLHPYYWRIGHKWNQGAAHIRTYPDGDFKVFNFRIFNGKVL